MVAVAKRSREVQLSGIRIVWEKVNQVRDIIRMEIGDPEIDTPDHIKRAAEEAIKRGFTHYTSSWGTTQLREAITRKMKRENNVEASPEQVVVTSGASGAIFLALSATVEPGEEVLIPDPGWPVYEGDVRLIGAIPVRYQLKGSSFNLDAESIRDLVSEKTRAIIINTPNNPTGAVYGRRELEELAELVYEHDLLIISDEVYEKIVFEGAHTSIASFPGMLEKTLTINSFSKTYAMTGWRVGYVVGPAEIISEIAKLNLFSNTCASSVSQAAALAALEGPQENVEKVVRGYKDARDRLVRGLNEIVGFTCSPPPGTFYAFPAISSSGMRDIELTNFLIDSARVSTSPGSVFGMRGQNHIRFSFATSIEKIELALERIDDAIKKRSLAPIS